MRSKNDIEKTIDTHGDTVWRACVLHFRNQDDAQDVFQDTFFKYSLCDVVFNDEEHKKAWLIRVATNGCKDILKAAYRKNIPIEDGLESNTPTSDSADLQPGSLLSEALDAIRNLGDPPRTQVYLSLYEGYTAPEISTMLDMPVNTVYSWVAQGKQQLREVLG